MLVDCIPLQRRGESVRWQWDQQTHQHALRGLSEPPPDTASHSGTRTLTFTCVHTPRNCFHSCVDCFRPHCVAFLMSHTDTQTHTRARTFSFSTSLCLLCSEPLGYTFTTNGSNVCHVVVRPTPSAAVVAIDSRGRVDACRQAAFQGAVELHPCKAMMHVSLPFACASIHKQHTCTRKQTVLCFAAR